MIRSVIVDNSWSSLKVEEFMSFGKGPHVRSVLDGENPKRFRVTFLVFSSPLHGENQVQLTYYGLDFKDCRRKMLTDTAGAAFKVLDVVDTENDYHKAERPN